MPSAAQARAAGAEELAALLLRLELDRSRSLRAQGPILEAVRRRAAEPHVWHTAATTLPPEAPDPPAV